jgi:hypothetical protein
VNNFEKIAKSIIDTSKGCNMAFAPLVRPEEVREFEDHAYKYYQEQRMPEPFPVETGVSSFGKGIWSIDPSIDNADQRYHDINGTTTWESPNQILAPMFHHSKGAASELLTNLHSNELVGSLIDSMLICANEKVQDGEMIEDCSTVTKILPDRTSWVQGGETGPGALLLQPVFPSNDPHTVSNFRERRRSLDRYVSNFC